jgi:pyruvate/2-oxoglutarate dehydrogenase complex dihydrolipoamide dehydrogenase (E3) component
MERYDAIVIGSGQSGPPLAARLANAGMRVAIVERGKFGGTCVNNGCTPTKAMVASAYVARLARTAGPYGIEIHGSVKVDMGRVKARKDAIAGKSSDAVERWMRSLPNTSVVLGHARFVDSRTVAVGAERLTAERIFIDVGGRPLVPKIAGLDRVSYLTSETMMDVDYLPDHLIVVGGSYIGLEFGQMFRRFGSRVTIAEMGPRLIGREDADVSDAVKDILVDEGIDVRLDAKCLALEPQENGIAIDLDCHSGAPKVGGTHVLLAVGRVPNTDDLGLAEAGIETDERGYIRVDDELRTSAAHVYALGDCNGRGAFTHTSYNDYEIVADNLLHGSARKVTDRVPIYALFIDPPLGRVGMSEAEATAAIAQADRNRQDYFRRFYEIREEQSTHYDLVINTDALTAQQAGDLIVFAARGQIFGAIGRQEDRHRARTDPVGQHAQRRDIQFGRAGRRLPPDGGPSSNRRRRAWAR